MTRGRRWGIGVGALVVGVVVVPTVVLGVGRFGAFDVFGRDDPLGDRNARVELVACLADGLDRLGHQDVVEAVLVVPRSDGSFVLPPGVDGFTYDFTPNTGGLDVLKIDFYADASDSEVSAIETALRRRPEVAKVLRRARTADCA